MAAVRSATARTLSALMPKTTSTAVARLRSFHPAPRQDRGGRSDGTVSHRTRDLWARRGWILAYTQALSTRSADDPKNAVDRRWPVGDPDVRCADRSCAAVGALGQ